MKRAPFCVSRNISHFNNWAKEKNSAKTNSKTYIQIFAGKDFKGEVRPEPDEMEQRLFPKAAEEKSFFDSSNCGAGRPGLSIKVKK